MGREYLIGIPSAEDVTITGLTRDSREVDVGKVFFAVRGEKVNGEEYIAEAVKKGACAVVIGAEGKSSEKEKGKCCAELSTAYGVPIFEVENVRHAFAVSSARFYCKAKDLGGMRLIGITGTNGKTTVSHMTAHILKSVGIKTAVMGTLGCGIYGEELLFDGMTTPPTEKFYRLLGEYADEGVGAVVFEASSQGIAQNRLDGIPHTGASASLAIFTNLSREHLDYHSDMEEYFGAKKKLFENFGFENYLINVGEKYGKRLYSEVGGCDVGKDAKCFATSDIEFFGMNGAAYDLRMQKGKFRVFCPSPGSFTAENSASAISAAVMLGADVEEDVAAVGNFHGVSGRMELISSSPDVIIDFAHTPRALKEAVSTVRASAGGKRITTVFGCGGDRDRGKRPIMGRIASELSDRIIITSDNSRSEDTESIIYDIMKGVAPSSEYAVIPDRGEAIEFAVNISGENDIIILAGKGHERYEEKNGLRIPFDEREKVFEALKKKKRKAKEKDINGNF